MYSKIVFSQIQVFFERFFDFPSVITKKRESRDQIIYSSLASHCLLFAFYYVFREQRNVKSYLSQIIRYMHNFLMLAECRPIFAFFWWLRWGSLFFLVIT